MNEHSAANPINNRTYHTDMKHMMNS